MAFVTFCSKYHVTPGETENGLTEGHKGHEEIGESPEFSVVKYLGSFPSARACRWHRAESCDPTQMLELRM